MRGLLAFIPLLVLAVHALVGQSGVMVCLGGSHSHASDVMAARGETCSHRAGLLAPAMLPGHAHAGANLGDPIHHEDHHHNHHGPNDPHDPHDGDCSCTDLLISLRDEVTVPRVHDDGWVWGIAAWVPCPWACDAWLAAVAEPDRRREWFQDPGGACCLAIVRSTRLLV